KGHQSGCFEHRVPCFLIQRNAELLTEYSFDALEIFRHENKLILDVSEPLQKLVKRGGELVEPGQEALVEFVNALFNGAEALLPSVGCCRMPVGGPQAATPLDERWVRLYSPFHDQSSKAGR